MKTSKSVVKYIGAVSVLLLIGFLGYDAPAAPGDVDLSFEPGSGVNGPVNAIVVQTDGKVLIGGQFTTVKGLVRTNIARLNADGSGDPTFSAGAAPNAVYALALQPDGKVLVGQDSDANYGITRLNADGSYDANFNSNAYAVITSTVPFDPFRVTALVAQPNGKVLYAGETLLRFNSDGTLDTNFNSAAIGYVYSMARQPDGKLIVGGYFYTDYVGGTPIGYGLARLNTDGSLDNTFDTAAGQDGLFLSIVVQPDGKVLVGGQFIGTNNACIARLNGNGTVDSAFAEPVGGTNQVTAIGLQADGKVIIGGHFVSIHGHSRTNLARLNPEGSLDSSFNSNIGPDFVGVRAVVVRPDDKMVIGGDSAYGTGRYVTARLNADGGLDGSFNPGRNLNVSASAVVVQPDGKVLIGDVFTFINGTNRYASARLNGNGSADSTFISATNFPPDLIAVIPSGCYDPSCSCYENIVPFALVVQADGKVLIGGYSATTMDCPPEGGDYFVRHFLVRFNADGSLDTSFEAAFGNRSSFETVKALAVQPDGKIIVGGTFFSIKGQNRNGIARLNANGSLDSSFNPGTGVNSVSSVALQPDGKVLIGGSFTSVNGTNRQGIARLNANGSLDSSFNPGTGVNGTVYSVALQPDGKALIGGSFTNVNGTTRNNIARLNANGSLDGSFNPGTGANGSVLSIVLQSDGNILIGGDFTTVNGVLRSRVARLYGDFARPVLNIVRSNSSAVLSWPAAFGNFQLQENTNVSLTNGWSAVAAPRSTNNNSISVALPATGSRKFFRLSSP